MYQFSNRKNFEISEQVSKCQWRMEIIFVSFNFLDNEGCKIKLTFYTFLSIMYLQSMEVMGAIIRFSTNHDEFFNKAKPLHTVHRWIVRTCRLKFALFENVLLFFPLKHEMHPQNSVSTLLPTALFFLTIQV